MNIIIISSSHPYKHAGIIAKDLLDNLKGGSNVNVKLIVKNWARFKDRHILN